MNTHPFQSRISYKGDLSKLLGEVVKVYDFGKYLSHSVVGIGYEDLNVVLETSSGKYLVKFLADFRSKEDCLRYAEIMQAVLAAKIAHPKLYKSKQGFYTEITLDEVLVRLLVFDYVEGKTFYELKQKPSYHERDFLVREAAKINQIKISPSFVYDSWAIVNFEKEFTSIKNKIDSKDLALIQPVVEEFSQLSLDDLPHCFVHGDIIDTNVIKENSGELFVLNFSVSNLYPRIQELAILLCDIFFDYERRGDFEILYEQVINKYQEIQPPTEIELETLPPYLKAAHAMHIVGASKTSIEEGDSKENDHWITMGRRGLEFIQELCK